MKSTFNSIKYTKCLLFSFVSLQEEFKCICTIYKFNKPLSSGDQASVNNFLMNLFKLVGSDLLFYKRGRVLSRSSSIGTNRFNLNRFWLKCTNRMHFDRFRLKELKHGEALSNNENDQKNEPTIFLPSGVHTKKVSLKVTPTLNLVFLLSFFLGLGLVFWLVLGFVLAVYSAGQK